MPEFKYKARGIRGDLLEGVLEGNSAEAVATQLLNGGLTPISIDTHQSGGGSLASWRKHLTARRPDFAELILFCRQMYTLMRSGVPIVRGMRGLSASTRNPAMVEVLEEITEDLESGRDLSSALGRFPRIFSTLFRAMVQVGENTGRLDESFLRIAQYLELERETRNRIKAALRYPSFVIVAITAAIAIINVFVIPTFANVFDRANIALPWATRLLVDISNFTVEYGVFILAGLIGGGFGVFHYLKTERGRYLWDKSKLRLPIVGSILHRATLGRFARAFSLTSRAGVPLIQALTVVSKALDNEFIGDRILQMRNGVERGDTLTRTAAGTGLFTPLILQMLAVGEETGAVDDLLEEVAGFYEREVDYEVKNLSASIEPILIVGVGIMVLILAMGVFLPMWDLATGVGMSR